MSSTRTPNPPEARNAVENARRERATVYAAGVRKAARFVTGFVGAVAGAFAEAQRQHRLYEELSRLSDSDLRDIGLNRSDIPAVVAGIYPRNDDAIPSKAAARSANDAGAASPQTDEERIAA